MMADEELMLLWFLLLFWNEEVPWPKDAEQDPNALGRHPEIFFETPLQLFKLLRNFGEHDSEFGCRFL